MCQRSLRKKKMQAISLIPESLRQLAHFGGELAAIAAPAQRPVEAVPFGARGTQHGVLQKRAIVSKPRRWRAVAGIGRALRAFHFLDSFVVGAQSEPVEHL